MREYKWGVPHRKGQPGNRAIMAAEVARLRVTGMTLQQTADAIGISPSYAQELDTNPDGSRAKARKDSYRQPCVDCGAMTSGSEGLRETPRCIPCAKKFVIPLITKWPRERIIAKIQEWAALYGSPPSTTDWYPGRCREFGDEERALRFEAGDWPWFTIVVSHFGTFNTAIKEAGFKPRRPYGYAENRRRKQPSKYQKYLRLTTTTKGAHMETLVLRKNGNGWEEVGTVEARSYADAVERAADKPGEYLAVPTSMVFTVAPQERLVATPRVAV